MKLSPTLQYNDANTVMVSYTAQSLDFSGLKYILPRKMRHNVRQGDDDNNIKSDSSNN